MHSPCGFREISATMNPAPQPSFILGMVIGAGGALALTRFMQSLLYETTPYDPRVYGGVALILLGATILACWLPARRAAKADVAQLLRTE